MSVFYHYNDQHIFISGQTYPLRAQIKALGGRFLGDRKIWMIPNNSASLSTIDTMCKNAGGGVWPLSKNESGESQQIKDRVQSSSGNEFQAVSSNISGDDQGALSVRELMEKAGLLIESGFPGAVWVTGEIQNLQFKNSGGFLDLAEEDPDSSGQGTYTVRCTLWKTQMRMIENQPGFKGLLSDFLQDGLKIRCLCKVNFYKGRGSISLNLLNIDPDYTKGALALAREKLLKELRIKGLDQANKKRVLPVLPVRIGLISAEGSRAYSDFVHQLESGGFKGHVLFVPCAMQGEKTPGMVIDALKQLEREKCDLIVLTRGGGSAADLRWFDDSSLAYALSAVSVPVLSAIGHHDDFCVVEEISFSKEKTPTAAADFIVERMSALREFLANSCKQIQLLAERRMFQIYQLFHYLNNSLVRSIWTGLKCGEQKLIQCSDKIQTNVQLRLQKLQESVSKQSFRLESGTEMSLQKFEHIVISDQKQRLISNIQTSLQTQQLKLINAESMLKSMDPTPWMNKGWTRLTSDSRDGYIKNVKNLEVNERVRAFYLDGSIEMTINKKSTNKFSKRI